MRRMGSELLAAIRAGEGDRLREVRARGVVPGDVGPLAEAPARGPFRVVAFEASYPDGEAGHRIAPAGFAGRRTVVMLDSFEVMAAQSRRRGGCAGLSPGQVQMGRDYRALVERYRSAGLRCSSMEGVDGGGDPCGFIDALVEDGRRIALLESRIGSGVALGLRRVRPSARAGMRAITDRALVDAVCLGDKTLTDVLRSHGWVVRSSRRDTLRVSLCTTLERMTGPAASTRIRVLHASGGAPDKPWG